VIRREGGMKQRWILGGGAFKVGKDARNVLGD